MYLHPEMSSYAEQRPWRSWPSNRPSNARIRLMLAAYRAYTSIARCWMSEEEWSKIMAEFECPGEMMWDCSEQELDVAEMFSREFWCAYALPPSA